MTEEAAPQRLPPWFKVKLNPSESFTGIRKLVKDEGLHTVCQEARCPNLHECWGTHGTASFMILGDICTRRCRFCAVGTGLPRALDPLEPLRVAASVLKMKLSHAHITMVNRDDLADGGASVMAATVRAIRARVPGCSVEVLTSDFMGSRDAISAVVKSSLMLGLGETRDEILQTFDDLRAADTDIVNLGQYLQPTRTNIAVQRYWTPEEFADLRDEALKRGFLHCESGPMVRSSYHAGEQYDSFRRNLDRIRALRGAAGAATG